MGAILFPDAATAELPTRLYVTCDDGLVWHRRPGRQACFNGTVGGVDARTISIVVNGCDEKGVRVAGFDRVCATAGLPPAVRKKLFPLVCRACGHNHQIRLRAAQRALRFVHPLAIETLRECMIPEYGLTRIWLRKNGDSPDEKTVSKRKLYLPVWVDDQERTLSEQLAHAVRWPILPSQD